MKKSGRTANQFVYGVMVWSQALVPVIALFSSIASAVRTFVAIRQIYGASVSDWIAIVVSLLFTVAVEGAIFTMSLAQERQLIKWRTAHKKRRVTTIVTIYHSIRVRLGYEQPLSYDQLPEGDTRLSLIIGIAFSFALVSNFYIGILALIEQMGNATLQSVFASLVNAPARVQMDFMIDVASILFPPFMALVAGHQTARFASGIVNRTERENSTPMKTERRKPRVDTQSERLPERSESFRKRPSERVIEWMAEHPEVTNQHQIARETGVSIGTVNAVFKSKIPELNHGSNGNHNGRGV